MTITQLNYVLALNKHKNFTKAAKTCMVSQPSLSMQIQKLEEELWNEQKNKASDAVEEVTIQFFKDEIICLLYTSPSPRD